jgi:hypothetical protein
MPLTLDAILAHFVLVANEKVCCAVCREAERICKNGHYWRFRFTGNGLEKVPRYLCKNPACPRVSFSILPHPFLPRLRVSLCFLTALWGLWRSGCHTAAALARQAGLPWMTLRRRLRQAEWVCRWIEREGSEAMAAWWPCADPGRSWTPFTQALSHAVRPG